MAKMVNAPVSRQCTPLAGLFVSLVLSFGAAAQSPAASPPDADSGYDVTRLAKKVQNLIGDLHSYPFPNHIKSNYEPHEGTQNILIVQQVFPIHIHEDWTIITRTILPLV